MRTTVTVTVTVTMGLMAATMQAGELNPKVLSLIGDHARAVQGANLARYQPTVWNELFPWRVDQSVGGSVQQLVTIAYDEGGTRPLTVLVGSTAASDLAEGLQYANLDPATAVFGDEAGVLEAVQRWSKPLALSELARKAQRLSEAYDNWFLIVKPLESLARRPAAKYSAFATELMQMVEEASGGIRLGTYSQVHIEVVMKTADDAVTLAGLARWLPGFVQLKEPDDYQSRIIDLAEDLSIRAEGKLATISFVIPERKLEDMLKATRSEESKR
ncbi:MAG: hypothetical protein JWP63_2312 [Candidatus Solibacter sp.]|nr:hypothetical protein [Candidatus Solibacter sp.]